MHIILTINTTGGGRGQQATKTCLRWPPINPLARVLGLQIEWNTKSTTLIVIFLPQPISLLFLFSSKVTFYTLFNDKMVRVRKLNAQSEHVNYKWL